ncbi:MAG: hypothetical protein V8Q40_12260 [Anaerosacchariphilus sp.]
MTGILHAIVINRDYCGSFVRSVLCGLFLQSGYEADRRAGTAL